MCGGGCGKVIGIAASFVVPYFAPGMLAGMGVTSALGQTIGSSIIGGMISQATGDNFLSGAAGSLIGSSVNAAFSGGEFDIAKAGNAFSTGQGAAPSSFFGGSTPSTSAISANVAGGGEMGGGMGVLDNSYGVGLNVNGTQGPMLDLSANTGSSLVMPAGGIDPSNPLPMMDLSNSSVQAGANQSLGLSGVLGKVGLDTGTALKALPQLAGVFGKQGPDMGDMQSYLDQQVAMDKQAYDFNTGMANKKAAIGDNLADSAASMDPSYYGRQQAFATQGQANNQWADTESKLRAQGYDENAINAQKQKFQLSSSQAVGTAFDQGSQAGLNARNTTYGTAGSMYGNVSGPTSRMSDYTALADKGAADAKAAGASIENLFKINQKDNKTGTDNTTVA